MKRTTPIASLVLLFLLSACGGGSGQPDLNGTSWVLTRLNGQPIIADTSPTIAFKDGDIRGNGSCNSFGGEYKVNGGNLTFGPLISTMMACLNDEVMEQESVYISALASAAKYRVENNQLILYNGRGQIIAEFTNSQ